MEECRSSKEFILISLRSVVSGYRDILLVVLYWYIKLFEGFIFSL